MDGFLNKIHFKKVKEEKKLLYFFNQTMQIFYIRIHDFEISKIYKIRLQKKKKEI